MKDVAIVTGAAAGIGHGIATHLAGAGYAVVAIDRDEAGLEKLRNASGGTIGCYAADLADAGSVDTAFDAVLRRHGSISVAVNNAGVVVEADLLSTTSEQWQTLLGVNLIGVGHVCRNVLPSMIAAGRGSIVNISSAASVMGLRRRAVYGASKAGVIGLTKAIAVDYARHNIRANAILPGTILTPLAESVIGNAERPEDVRRGMALRQPLGRMGRPLDIAYAVEFLASDRSSFITGATLAVDGGWSCVLDPGDPTATEQ